MLKKKIPGAKRKGGREGRVKGGGGIKPEKSAFMLLVTIRTNK